MEKTNKCTVKDVITTVLLTVLLINISTLNNNVFIDSLNHGLGKIHLRTYL